MTPEKASMRKLLRTRSADQLRSALGTTSKLTAACALVAPLLVAIGRKCDGTNYWLGPNPPGRGGRTPPGRGGYGRRPANPPGPPGRGPPPEPTGRRGREDDARR